MIKRRVIPLLLTLIALGGCRETPRADAAEMRKVQQTRQQQLARRLAMADSNPAKAAPVAQWIMPPELKEISGLALTSDGRLLTHDDNVGRIFVIDPRSGLVLKNFYLGSGVHGDFESITIAGDDIYMLDSNGTLYQFREGADGAGVPFNTTDLRLGKECEFESMAFQADSNWLVMPCKKATSKKLKDQLVIYRWRLQGPGADRLSMTTIPVSQIIGGNGWKNFTPSDMTIDPVTGNYVLIASHEKALAEITTAGRVVRSGKIPGVHNQAEGVAITKDGILIVSDEENKTQAAITLYRWRR